MSFTDQKPRIATEQDCSTRWYGQPASKAFRCYLCGHRFRVGDVWRWIWMTGEGLLNPMVCAACDTPDVKDKWRAAVKEAEERFWWV